MIERDGYPSMDRSHHLEEIDLPPPMPEGLGAHARLGELAVASLSPASIETVHPEFDLEARTQAINFIRQNYAGHPKVNWLVKKYLWQQDLRRHPEITAASRDLQNTTRIRLGVEAFSDGQETQALLDAAAACDVITLHYTGLVQSFARRFSNSFPSSPITFEDFVQEGMAAIANSIRRFDDAKGSFFYSYASSVITGSMHHLQRDKGSMVSISRNLMAAYKNLSVLENEYYTEHHIYPTAAYLAAELGISEEDLQAVIAARSYKSLEWQAEDGGEPLMDSLAGSDAVDEMVESKLLRDILVKSITDFYEAGSNIEKCQIVLFCAYHDLSYPELGHFIYKRSKRSKEIDYSAMLELVREADREIHKPGPRSAARNITSQRAVANVTGYSQMNISRIIRKVGCQLAFELSQQHPNLV